MPRKGHVPKREVLPDPLYHDIRVAKLINNVMLDGKKKLAYGQSPEDALNILSIRLSEEEMKQILTEQFIRINQRELQQYVGDLG